MKGIQVSEFAHGEASRIEHADLMAAMEGMITEDLDNGQLMVLSESATAIVVVVITIAIGALILAQVQSNATVSGNATANTAINDGLSALGQFTGFLGVIAIVIVAVVLLLFVKLIGQ